MGRLNHSQLRMAHANEGFCAAKIERLAVDLGLVPQFEPTRRMAVRADAARIDVTCERGRYSLRLRRHVPTPRMLAGPQSYWPNSSRTSSRCESS